MGPQSLEGSAAVQPDSKHNHNHPKWPYWEIEERGRATRGRQGQKGQRGIRRETVKKSRKFLRDETCCQGTRDRDR